MKRKLRKSKDSVIDGVCGGIANWIGIDPIFIRLLFALCGWIVPYVILMFIMEE